MGSLIVSLLLSLTTQQVSYRLLNSMAAGLMGPSPTGVYLICKGPWFIRISLKTFFIVVLMGFIRASAWPLHWWLCNNDTATCSMFSFLQNPLNFSETKLVPASDMIFRGSPYSLKLFCSIELSFILINIPLLDYRRKWPLLIVNKSVPINFHGLPGILWGMTLSFGCVCWNTKYVEFFLTVCSMSVFMLIQYIESLSGRLLYSMHTWLLCNCSSVLGCSATGMVMLLPFIATPLLITSSSLHSNIVVCLMSFFFDGYSSIMYVLSPTSASHLLSLLDIFCWYGCWFVSCGVHGVDVHIHNCNFVLKASLLCTGKDLLCIWCVFYSHRFSIGCITIVSTEFPCLF